MHVGFIGIPMMMIYIFGLPLAAYLATRKLQLRAKRKNIEPSLMKGVSKSTFFNFIILMLALY